MAPSEHTRISPSMLKAMILCPQFESSKGSSKYADEGTAAHALGELCLLGKIKTPVAMLGKKINVAKEAEKERLIEVTEDMIGAVQVYLDFIATVKKYTQGGEFKIETKLDMEYVVPGMKGTADFIAVEPLSTILVVDYKHGQGVAVDAEMNPQLLAYALGAIGPNNPTMVGQVTMAVVQPRAPHPDGPIRQFTISVEDLYQWGYDVLAPAAKLYLDGTGGYNPGEDQCRWCAKKHSCVGLRQKAIDAAGSMFDPITTLPTTAPTSSIDSLTPEQLGAFKEWCGLFQALIDAVDEKVHAELRAGNAVPGWKMVDGKKSRSWADEAKVAGALVGVIPPADSYESKLKTVAAMEKEFKKRKLDFAVMSDHVVTKRGVAVVPESDKRPAINPAETMFSAITEEEM